VQSVFEYVFLALLSHVLTHGSLDNIAGFFETNLSIEQSANLRRLLLAHQDHTLPA